jgi:prepilin-type N-terminal cleavage/methylation domain-containing protein
MKKNFKFGFTLIELLVVISIIAILAGIALPVYGFVTKRAYATKAASDMRQIAIGFKIYVSDNDDNSVRASGDSWVLFDPAADHFTLYPKYVESLDVFKNNADNRTGEGKEAPVSYSFNEGIAKKEGVVDDGTGPKKWVGNFSDIESMSRTILILPNYTGTPKGKDSFGTASTNTAKGISLVPLGGGAKTEGFVGQTIPVVYCDGHVETKKLSELRDLTEGWDPMKAYD